MKLAFTVAGAVGAGLLILLLAMGQIGAAGAADEVVDAAAPLVTEESVGQMRSDLDEVRAATGAIEPAGLDSLAQQAGQSREELDAELAQRYPEFTESLAEAPEVSQLADMVIGNLERRIDQFDSAESLPGLGLSLQAAAWGQLLLAVAVIALAVLGITRPRRVWAWAIATIGAGMVIVPLILGYPSKTSDTDELLDSLRPFSREKVVAREQGLATARNVFDGYREDVLPYVAERSGSSTAEVESALGSVDPALSPPSLDEIPPILDRFEELVEFSDRIQPKLVEADTISATTGVWIFMGAGAVLLLSGVAAARTIRG